MDYLIKIKEVVLDLVVSLSNRPEMEEISNLLLNTQRQPLIEFYELHRVFTAQVTNSSDLFDKWLSIQIQVMTELGADKNDCIKEFSRFIEHLMISNSVSSTFELEANELADTSMFTLLAIRAYAPLIEFVTEETNK